MAYTFGKKIIGLDFRGISFGAVTYATWNPADKSAGTTLSNGNLTGAAGYPDSVRSTIGKSSGKWYWEYTVDDANNRIGLGVAGAGVLPDVPGFSSPPVSWGYAAQTGNITKGGVGNVPPAGDAYVQGSIIGIALDMDNLLVYFYKNNVEQGGAGGRALANVAHYASFGSNSGNVVQVTANFGASALTYTPPSGFNAGLYV